MKPLILIALLLAACTDDETLAPDGVCTTPVCGTATTLCTTDACAAEPCTTGCRFHNPRGGDCPTNLPKHVAPKDVTSCPFFCGFAVPLYASSGDNTTAPGSCFHYDAEAPGCAGVPACLGYNQACWVGTVGFASDEAAICASNDVCNDGAVPLEDMAQPNTCDMAEPLDLSHVD